MGLQRITLPSFWATLPDLAAFSVGLGCTWLLGWHTTDLVWCLWLSSLVIGYLTIVAAIGRCVFIGSAVVFSDLFPPQLRLKAILTGSGIALFVLAFFSVHFCAFHAVHATFLSAFFPPAGVPKGAFVSFFFNPIPLWKTAFHYLMPLYGIFLIPVVIAERRALFGSIEALVRARRIASGDGFEQLLKTSGVSGHDVIGRPYLNVVRMHILIFFFAICHALKVDAFPIYVVVYSVYFFPWSAFRRTAEAPQAVPPGAPQIRLAR